LSDDIGQQVNSTKSNPEKLNELIEEYETLMGVDKPAGLTLK
jgi:hypothetical protein